MRLVGSERLLDQYRDSARLVAHLRERAEILSLPSRNTLSGAQLNQMHIASHSRCMRLLQDYRHALLAKAYRHYPPVRRRRTGAQIECSASVCSDVEA
jgi:hypothetical protein